jgi:hypothetical protein
MSIVDVSNPDVPIKIADFELPPSQIDRSSCSNVKAVGGLASLGCVVDDDNLRLYILNVSDPASIGVWNTVDGATAAIAADRYIYTLNGAEGLKILRFDLPRSFFLPLVGRSSVP